MTNKIISLYTKYFAVWVLIMGVIAYYYPRPFVAMKEYMTMFFALTMFGIGAVLSLDDFKRIGQRPTIVIIGSVAQFSIMPFGAFLVAKIFNLPDAIAVGLILAGCAPGAMASNVMCYIACADTAYSVSLTTVSTLLCPVITPALTMLLAGSVMDVEFLPMFYSVVQMVILPLALGFLVRRALKEKMDKVVHIFPAISVTFIIFICSLVIALNREYLGMLTISIFCAAVLLNLYGMSAGYGVGALFKMSTARKRTLCIEIGMQNAGLGTVLALKHFGAQAAIPTAIFVFICIITASIISEFWRRDTCS
ncbi:MAG: bile acid:sodium symporter family protein [Sedimentisphaerales bacterium]|nr:bile acid:sodium symporter family protein [Sedimentisphaerales bacterium]